MKLGELLGSLESHELIIKDRENVKKDDKDSEKARTVCSVTKERWN